jgi:hypothetical protein
MNTAVKSTLAALLLLVVAASGYWFGKHRTEDGGLRTETQAVKKVLYYRNPMGLSDTSPVPKKDSMGMDYVPVYEGEAGTGSNATINLSNDKVQKLGVKSEAAAMRSQRAPHLCHLAQIRRLGGTPVCEHDRRDRCQRSASVRGVQPGTGLGLG